MHRSEAPGERGRVIPAAGAVGIGGQVHAASQNLCPESSPGLDQIIRERD